MRRPGLKDLNNFSHHPRISDMYYIPDHMDPSGDLPGYCPDYINKWNYKFTSFNMLNKKDYRINKEDYFKL